MHTPFCTIGRSCRACCWLQALCTEAALAALRRRYPQIYASEQRLLVDADQVAVERADFLAALGSITPASHRSAVTHARCLAAPQSTAKVSRDACKVHCALRQSRQEHTAALSSIWLAVKHLEGTTWHHSHAQQTLLCYDCTTARTHHISVLLQATAGPCAPSAAANAGPSAAAAAGGLPCSRCMPVREQDLTRCACIC